MPQSSPPTPGLPSRSKGGCLTCKAKHIKCDEARPACQRCTHKGLQCGGYRQGVRWVPKHQLHLPSHHTRAPGPVPASAPNSAPASSSSVPRAHQSLPQPASLPTETLSSSSSSPSSSSLHISNSQVITTASAPTVGLVDSTSAFIVHWFENVCPAWSGFDSNANPIRTIAVDVWRSSVTVCSALEAMSAAFLASRDPNVRQPALRLMRRAADYAQVELGMMRMAVHPSENRNGSMALPTGLLFSLFGLGTTVCWVDARSLGLPFFRETRRLLARLNRQQRISPGAVDAERLEFFNKCMTYCDMLLSVVHDDVVADSNISSSILPTVPHDWPGFRPLPPFTSSSSSSSSVSVGPSTRPNIVAPEKRPHPWTGISSLASRLFAETMTLCRRTQLRSRPAVATPSALYLRAECLEEQLLDAEIEVPTVPDPDAPNSLRSLGDTGDSRTPPSHLALIAEAYRLSSLLVLYETFPSLGFLRLPGRAPTEGGGCLSNAVSDAFSLSLAGSPAVLWQEWITPLSLHLLQVLERIPPTSGSRVIQPLLYICASTGLRQPDMTVEAELAKVSQGRNFIMQRLTILESSLPPTPVRVAKELVRAIWRAHDATPPGTTPVHWINVMEVNDLRSMFG